MDEELDLSKYGAPGFSLKTRLDFSGHSKGTVDPHVNCEVVKTEGRVVSRDLANTQLPGFNGMQSPKSPKNT